MIAGDRSHGPLPVLLVCVANMTENVVFEVPPRSFR